VVKIEDAEKRGETEEQQQAAAEKLRV